MSTTGSNFKKGIGFLLIALGLGLLVPWVLKPLMGGISMERDRDAIHRVVESQLEAFLEDDAERAFSLVSPTIQARMRTPGNFMAMIRTRYRPVYRHRAVFFQDDLIKRGAAAQRVLVVANDNALVIATYLLQRQADGNWRIGGCYLVPSKGILL